MTNRPPPHGAQSRQAGQLTRFWRRLGRRLLRRLETAPKADRYPRRIHNNMTRLYREIRKGDVVLVEGRSEISGIIKVLTTSSWSHVGMYVGDALIRPGHPSRREYLKRFGDDARHLIVEALVGDGVIVAPLRKYRDFNIRICRPFGIQSADLDKVLADVIGNIGKHYDNQNILDIALMLLPFRLSPFRHRSVQACLGNCNDFAVICSGMIARAFQRVGYPIVPAFKPVEGRNADFSKSPYGSELIMRHYSQIFPRDFDLSPNFAIIKFNIIATGRFHYRSLPWHAKL